MNRSRKALLTCSLAATVMAGCLVSPNDDDSDVVDYLDTTYITSAKSVSEELGSTDLLILDARGDSVHALGHIPGAVSVTWQQFSDMSGGPGTPGFGTVLPPAKLAPRLDSVGVSPDKKIVVYGNPLNGWGEDGRIVWMLRMAGIARSSILNGGYPYWVDRGYPTSTTAIGPAVAASGVVAFDSSLTAATDYVSSNISSLAILDSRTQREYEGAADYGEARGGHIPGALLFSYNTVFTPKGTIRPQDELEAAFEEAGLSKSDDIVAYCTAGIRSGHLCCVLRMAGYDKARNYDASFYEWAGDSTLDVE